ncbi:MAG TPA: glycosyltransferase [bacterium]|nr:glycosyltransferase [bacterium]
MIAGRDFIVFSDDWGRHPSSCQHLFRRLAPRNRVLWVNTIGTRTPTLSWHDVRRAAGKLREWTSPAEDPASEDVPVSVIRPFMTPFDRFRPLRSWNAGRLRAAVSREAASQGLERTILLTTIPNAAGVVGRLGEALSVYYCVDEFSEWPGADRRAMLDMEAQLLERVDLVVAASETLFESKSARHARVRLLPHGVDWEGFRSGRGAAPADLKALPHPRCGYAGLVDERLDMKLVADLARAMPEVTFVFVGPRQTPPGEADGLPNVRFLPAVAYADVPAVVAELDAALLPYVTSRLTDRMNPLKLRELLASGVPVVSSPLPEVKKYVPEVRLAADRDEWRGEIAAALHEGRSRAEERAERVRSEGWDARAEELSRLLESAEAAARRAS